MMDKVLCPYCGWEMAISKYNVQEGGVIGHVYFCEMCDSTSPIAGTKSDALSAALQRYVEPAKPTVDAVAVVRCRDCKHSEPIPPKARNAFYPDRVLVCKSWRGDYDVTHDISVTWKDGYCDEGERKEPADGRTD